MSMGKLISTLLLFADLKIHAITNNFKVQKCQEIQEGVTYTAVNG